MTAGEREHEHGVEDQGSAGYERAIAFSDGVFAIAITLLVLGLGVPEVADGELPDALRDLGPQVTSYFIGFAVIGAFWLGHHRFFGVLRRFDSTLLLLNLAFLSFISLMPFTTGLLGRYGGVEVAVVAYAANVIAASAADTAMLWVALRRGLLAPSHSGDPAARLFASFFPGLVFLCSIPVALVAPRAAVYTWLALLLGGPRVLRLWARVRG